MSDPVDIISDKIEMSSLQGVDIALGVFLADAYTNHDGAKGPKAWQDFLTRPMNQRIYRYDPLDIPSFLKVIKASGKMKKTDTAGNTVSERVLPIIGYSRKPGISNADDPFHIQSGWLTTSHGGRIKTRMTKVQVDYSVRWLAWDRNTIDVLVSAWARHIVKHGTFPSYFTAAGIELLEIDCQIQNHTTFSISDASVIQEGIRIYAGETIFTVETFITDNITLTPLPDPIRIQFAGRIMGNSGDSVTYPNSHIITPKEEPQP